MENFLPSAATLLPGGSVSEAVVQGRGRAGNSSHPRLAQQTGPDAGNSAQAAGPKYPPQCLPASRVGQTQASVIQQEPRGPTGDRKATLKVWCVPTGTVEDTWAEQGCSSPQDHLPLSDLEWTRVVLPVPDSLRSPGVGTTGEMGVPGVTQAHLAIILW